MGYWGFYSPIVILFSLAIVFVTFAIHLHSFMQGQVTKSSWTGGRADMRVLILSTQASWTDGPSAGRTDGKTNQLTDQWTDKASQSPKAKESRE